MNFRISPKTILNFSIVLFIVSAGFLLLPKPAQAAITYNPSQNRITVTEGTEASPNTFTGIYNADKAGTLDLITRTGINGVDGSPVNNIYNLRPADEKLLGGAKHDLYITITNWDATTATIQLVGTDENGGALTEDIVVTANGTYNATQLFKTLTQTQVTVFDGTIFDYKLTQGQWGAVWKTDKGFFISSHLHIGNGATVTYLTTFGGEQIQVGAEASADRRAICLTTNAHFWMGKLDTEGYGYDGSNLLWYCYYSHAEQGQGGYNMWKGDFRIYGSTLVRYTYQAGYAATTFSGQVQMIDSALQSLGNRGTWYFPSSGTGTIRRSILDCNYYIYIYPTGLTIDRLYLTKYNTGILSGGSATISNVDYGTAKKHQNYYNAQTNLIDSTILNENVLPSASGYNGVVNKKFHLDLKVIDKDNNPINGASVKIWNNEGALVADTTTNANGIIPQQLLTPVYFHYVLPQSGGTWTTTNDNPFTIRISHQNYPSREFKFTLDKKMDLTLALKDKPLSEGTVKVLGTEYESSDATAAVYAQILNGDGSPGTSATVTLTVYDRDGNVVTGFDGVSMTHIANGIYRYSMTTPAAEGTYAASVVASNPTAYGVGDFHIASWANKIASKADIASEVEATLSASHGIGSWLGTSPADVWAYESRTLSGFGTLVADVWKNTDNIGSTLATNLGKAIWEYSTRTLSNFGTLAADVWSNATRQLTSRYTDEVTPIDLAQVADVSGLATSAEIQALNNISASDVWAYAGDRKLSAAGVDEVWEYALTEIGSAGSIGKLLKDNIDASITSRSSHTAADVWGVVARTLTSNENFNDPTSAQNAAAVWAYATKELTNYGNDITAAEVWEVMSDSLTTSGSIGKQLADNCDAKVSTRSTLTATDIWGYEPRSLTSFGTLVADIWSNASRTLSSALLGSGGELATKTTVETATSSAVTSIKGTSGKDLTDISGEIAGVQTTVTSIESKVDSLHTKVDTVNTNVETIVSKWSSYSASDIIGYVDEMESRLGDNADTCVSDDTVFGNIQCIRDKWGDTQTADTIYTAANNAYDTTVLVRAELAYSGKSTTAYDDIQSLKGYVDTLESSIGSSSDTSSNNTVFGKIKGVQDSVDQLTTIDTNIDTLVSKWGSYSASDIYDKVKNLSSDISAINTVSNVSSILSLAQTDADNMTDLKNKVLGMKAVVDVNRMLLDGLAHQPVIKTWLEEGSVIFKTLITNPSQLYTQTVPLKYYLPREANKEDIIKMNEGLSVEYDASREAYYVNGEFKLKPGETKTFSVEVADVWQIPEEEITSLKNQADELFEPLKKTSYFAQGSTLKNDIYASLDKAESLMKNAYTPEARIRAYREALIEIESAKRKLEDMKTLVSSAGSIGTMFGFMGGVSTVGTFGIIIVVIVGIAFLGLLFRQLFTGKTIKVTAEDGKKQELARINFWEKMKNGFNKTGNGLKNGARKIKNGVLGKKAKLGIIIFLVAGGVILGANLFRGGEGKQEQKEVSPSPTPTLEPMSTEKKVKVLNTEVNYLNVREGPGSEYKKITRVDVSEEFIELERKENSIGEEWVKISLEGVEGLPSEALAKEGWVLGKYVENVGEKILGAVAGQKVMVVVPAGASGVNIREKPSLDSKILARFWVSKKVNWLDEINGWVKIEIEVEKDGIKYSEGWVSKQLIEKIEE